MYIYYCMCIYLVLYISIIYIFFANSIALNCYFLQHIYFIYLGVKKYNILRIIVIVPKMVKLLKNCYN